MKAKVDYTNADASFIQLRVRSGAFPSKTLLRRATPSGIATVGNLSGESPPSLVSRHVLPDPVLGSMTAKINNTSPELFSIQVRLSASEIQTLNFRLRTPSYLESPQLVVISL